MMIYQKSYVHVAGLRDVCSSDVEPSDFCSSIALSALKVSGMFVPAVQSLAIFVAV